MSLPHLLRSTVMVSLLAASSAHAGEAVFAKDGQSVAFTSFFNEDSILRLDLGTRKLETVALGAAVKGQHITSLTSGGDGELLFLTEKAAWVNDAKGTRRLCNVGAVKYPRDLVAAPAKAAGVADWLFLSGPRSAEDGGGGTEFYGRKPGDKAFTSMFCRRVNSVWAGAFASDGRFFFAGEGDLWEGSFDPEPAGGGLGSLSGVRIAPLAMMNTDSGNGGNLWVTQVMPAGKSIYVRLRGTHMGELLRVPMNPVPALDEKSGAMGSLEDHYKYLSKSLASVQRIETSGDDITASAAAVRGGDEVVFFRTRVGGGKWGLMLWSKSTGKAEQVAVEEE